jgi:hypothetical protein
VRRAALACCTALALLAATAAQAQMELPPKLRPPHDNSKLLDQLARDFPPRPFVMRPVVIKPTIKIVVPFDAGGSIGTYENRWRMAAAEDAEVAIVSGCQSACSLVLAFIPRDRLCFGEFAYLSFHQAREANSNTPAPAATRWMVERYPADIRAWIEAKGGIENMPFNSYWTLGAKQLWAMGYRRCAD